MIIQTLRTAMRYQKLIDMVSTILTYSPIAKRTQDKLLKVIKSCQNEKQLNTAANMINNYNLLFGESQDVNMFFCIKMGMLKAGKQAIIAGLN